MQIQAEANLSALIESTEDLIWSVDLDDRLISFNSALQRHHIATFGIRTAVGMRPSDLVPPERANLMPSLYERARTEGPVRVEFPLPDGRTLDLALSPILVDGKVTGVSVFGKDITEMKAAVGALREAKEKYRAIFDGALEGIFQTSPEGKLLTANPALAKMLGYDSVEQMRSMAGDVVHDIWENPEDRASFLRHLDESKPSLGCECRLRRKDGTLLWALVNARRVFGSDGQLLNYEGFLVDISERKRAEEAQREGLDILRETQLIGALGSYVLDIPAGMWTSSDALDKFFGIGKEYERTLAGWAALIHPDDRAMMTAYFAEEVLGNAKAFDKEYRIVRHTDGEEHWVHGMGRLEFDAQGKPSKMRGVIKDITGRKQAEMQLRDSEERYRNTFEQAPVGVVHTSFEGRILRCNARFAEILGYSPEEISGKTVQQLTAPEDLSRSIEHLQPPSNDAAQTSSFEKRFIRKDGSLAWTKLTISIQRDANGRPLHFITFAEDINARKASEEKLTASDEALRASEERYRVAFQTSLDCVNINRLDDGVYVDVNRAFVELIGHERQEILGRSSLELDIWADPRDRQKLTDGLRLNSVVRNLEAQFRKKNGALIWGLMSASLIELDGVPCVLSVTRDITESKAAAERLAATTEALRLGEERYRTVFDTCPNAIIVSRLSDGVVIEANQAYLDAADYSRDQVIGRNTIDLGIWPDAASRQRLIDCLLKNNECRDMDFQAVRRTGEPFWMRISASLIEISGDKCIVAFAQDISDAKAAEEHLAAAANAVRLSEERYRTVFQTCPDSVQISRVRDGAILDANQAFIDTTGYQRNEALGRSSQQLGLWLDDADRTKMIDALARGESVRSVEVRSRRKNGEFFWIRLSACRIEIEGEPCQLTFATEVTEVKAAEERLASATDALLASEERYRTVFHTSLDCITVSHLSDGRYIDVNKAFLDLIGVEPHEIVGKTSTELGIWAHPGTRAEIVEMLRRNPTFRDYQTEFVKKSGERFWVLISATVIEIGGLPCLVSVVRDITGVKAAESTIHTLALYDPLTGLPNRRMLFERLGQTLDDGDRKGSLKALLLVDIDNLKVLNETLGHHTGDLFLQEVARRIAACAHDADTVGRLGGDEFVVILDGLSEVPEEAATQAKAAGEDVLASIGQPCQIESRECHPAASLGITVYDGRVKTADEILQQADIALHLAKTDGRNTLRFFSPALQAVVNARATLEKDLRRAIKERQFLLYYQPQVERGKMTGAEALIRWKHPSRGIVPPDEFIPLAEESRLILPLGDWVLTAACQQIAAWAGRDQTAHLTISVNISALQFRQPEFVEHVLAALDRTGANPKNLKLELTESMLVENFEDVIAKMTELKAHGLSFSLDDFGTGYSSLAYLKRLPLDQLKIDRAFVRDMLVDLTSGAIAQTIIALGRAMDLSVVAEGVENEEQRGFLAGLGCHCFQGYLFSRPIPIEEFQALI